MRLYFLGGITNLDVLENEKKCGNKEPENGIVKEGIFVVHKDFPMKSCHFLILKITSIFSLVLGVISIIWYRNISIFLAFLNFGLTLLATICCYLYSKDLTYCIPMIILYYVYFRYCPRLIYKEDFNEQEMVLAEKFDEFVAANPWNSSIIRRNPQYPQNPREADISRISATNTVNL